MVTGGCLWSMCARQACIQSYLLPMPLSSSLHIALGGLFAIVHHHNYIEV